MPEPTNQAHRDDASSNLAPKSTDPAKVARLLAHHQGDSNKVLERILRSGRSLQNRPPIAEFTPSGKSKTGALEECGARKRPPAWNASDAGRNLGTVAVFEATVYEVTGRSVASIMDIYVGIGCLGFEVCSDEAVDRLWKFGPSDALDGHFILLTPLRRNSLGQEYLMLLERSGRSSGLLRLTVDMTSPVPGHVHVLFQRLNCT